MTVRWPLVPADAAPNRFGWRHEGPGVQWPEPSDTNEQLLPSEDFDHPELKRPPAYVPEHEGEATFDFMMLKGCAGLAHEFRRQPAELYARIKQQALERDDEPALRWMITGLRKDEDFVALHTMGRLSIQELAYLVRTAFGAERAPFRRWLNQWARDPHKPLPSLPGTIGLKSENDLVGLHIDDIPPGDDRRIDEDGITYLKIYGHMYWLRRQASQVDNG